MPIGNNKIAASLDWCNIEIPNDWTLLAAIKWITLNFIKSSCYFYHWIQANFKVPSESIVSRYFLHNKCGFLAEIRVSRGLFRRIFTLIRSLVLGFVRFAVKYFIKLYTEWDIPVKPEKNAKRKIKKNIFYSRSTRWKIWNICFIYFFYILFFIFEFNVMRNDILLSIIFRRRLLITILRRIWVEYLKFMGALVNHFHLNWVYRINYFI